MTTDRYVIYRLKTFCADDYMCCILDKKIKNLTTKMQ